MLDLMRLGGPVMWPLAACSLLASIIILERFITLGRTQLNSRQFLEDIAAALKRSRPAEALALCEQVSGPLTHMVRAGLMKHGRSREEIQHAIEDAGHRQLPQLERNLASLATLAHVAPLLGLLGTVLGLIRCFQIIQMKAAIFTPVSPADLAQGVWQALLTTAAGLIVAIPAMVAYNYFARRIQRTVWEMELAAGDCLNLLAGEAP